MSGTTDRPWASTITGRVDVTTLLRAGKRQVVRVYLPTDYERTEREYPVLYMFDGNNLFDRTTTAYGGEWCIDETLEDLHSQGRTNGIVVVGVDGPDTPTGRYAHYSAWDWIGPGGEPITATGAVTADFLVSQVMPYVERTYRISRDRRLTGIGGSSMGGYMTLYTGARHTDRFGIQLAFSPAVLAHPMRGDQLFDYLSGIQLAPGTRVYLDMGDAEELSYTTSRDLVRRLWETHDVVAQMGPAELVARVVPGAPHTEQAWSERFPEVFLWAYESGPAPR